MNKIGFALLILLCMVTLPLWALPVFETRLNYTIMLPDKPTPTEQLAADELKTLLKANYTKPIVVNGTTEPVVFYVGGSATAAVKGLTPVLAPDREFGLFRQGRSFLFFGYDDDSINPAKTLKGKAGTLLAVYYFLQKYAGITFILPGKDGIAFSANQSIRFQREKDIPSPTFSVRGMYLKTADYSQEEMVLYSRRLLCTVPKWANAQHRYTVLNWHKRFTTKPDYLALVNGKRTGKYPYHIPCTSNKAVIRQIAADIIRLFNHNRTLHTVSLFCDGPLHPCQCTTCLNSQERKLCNEPDFSEDYFAMVTKVATIVTAYHPDKYLMVLTKRNLYCRPPSTIKWNPNVSVDVLTNLGWPVKKFAERKADLKLWKKAGAKTMIRGYRYPRYKDFPIINPQYTANYFKTFAGLTCGTLRSDCYKKFPYAYCALNQYIQGNMLFNASQDANKLIDKFVNFCYPGAKVEMKQFITEMEHLWMKPSSINVLARTYHYDNLTKAISSLEQAKAKLNGRSKLFNSLYSGFQKFTNESRAYAAKHPLLKLPTKAITAGKLNAIKLDGLVDSAEWNGACSDSLASPKSYPNFQSTKVLIGNDGKNICIGIIANEKRMKELTLNCHQNGKRTIFKDDSFEIMLVPPGGERNGTYWQICVNADGYYTMLPKGNISPSLQLTLKSSKNANNHQVELLIPMEQFSPDKLNGNWRVNIFRNRVLNDTSQRQSSGLRFFGGSYHNLDDYAILKLK